MLRFFPKPPKQTHKMITMKIKHLVQLTLAILILGCQSQQDEISESAVMENTTGQIVHHVFFWLNNPESEADKQQLIEGLNTLREIEEVKELLIGTPASILEREVVDNSFHVSELMMFENVEAQDAYQVHPIHEEFVQNYSHLWERVVVYDMIVQ